MRRLIPCCVFLFALAMSGVANGDPIEFFTVSGTGGLTDSIAGISDSPSWWINASGGVTQSATWGLTTFLPQDGLGFIPGSAIFRSMGGGSFLLSDPFTLGADDSVSIAFSTVTAYRTDAALAGAQTWGDVDFAALLENDTIVALLVLGTARNGGCNCFGSDLPHPPEYDFLSFGTGVGPIDNFTLGGYQYGLTEEQIQQTRYGAVYCWGPCVKDFASTYAPGAGTYQLLLGATSATGDMTNALIVTSATTTVPEPATLQSTLLGITLFWATMIFVHRRYPVAPSQKYRRSSYP